jgi:hypothetical protein
MFAAQRDKTIDLKLMQTKDKIATGKLIKNEPLV